MSHDRVNQAALREERGHYRAPSEALSCLDLFCGCGGFSLGMQRAGFNILAAIDASPIATAAFDQNFPAVPFVFAEDLTTFSPDALAGLLGRDSVDVVVGPSLPGLLHCAAGGRGQPRTAVEA